MPYQQQSEPLSRQLTIVMGLTVVGFMAFGLALSYYRNALFEETLKNIASQNRELKEGIDHGYQDLEYYRSTQYKDKYAKENLGLVRPGESVLILTQQPSANPGLTPSAADENLTEQQEATYFELLRQMPTFEHWTLYLFHREKIQELQKAL